MIVLFGGAAGVGKTTVARLWCESRVRSVHIQLDDIRDLIVSSLTDPQVPTAEQSAQYSHSVAACTALARSFARAGYDVAVDDIFEPKPTRELWLPQLRGFDVRFVALHPPLDVARSRAVTRQKRVLEQHIRAQHASMSAWPPLHRVDSREQTPAQTLQHVVTILESVVIE